ncbi:MAG TPA: hypothetical protein VFE51_00600 [Verrucomicrobiae bacterium]|nr:hypothetical protein [Verrucomicrobiae bacterium]
MLAEDPRPIAGAGKPISKRRDKAGGLRLVLICFFLAGLGIRTPANPAKAPKRRVNNFPVDLTPLFSWWTNQHGQRPLSAWVRITGSIVGTNSGAWVIEGKAEPNQARIEAKAADGSSGSSAGPQRLLLRNPPVEDLAEFERLRSRLAELNQQRAGLVSQENQAKSRDQAVNEQQRASRRNRARARVLAAEDKQLKQAQTQAKNDQKPLDTELKEIKAKLAGYPNPDRYALDCFALDLQYDAGALPVYDHGQTSN